MKKLLTTGEVAELLGVSRLTVQRKFDRGELWGTRHPVTGKRFISRECVKQVMREFGLLEGGSETQEKDVLICSPDSAFAAKVAEGFARDDRIRVDRVAYGADALVRCSREQPDLLVVDEELEDLRAENLLRAIRRTGLEDGLKIILCTRAGATGEYLEWGADACVSKENLDEASVALSAYPLLELVEPDSMSTEPIEHQRRWPRFPVNLKARLDVYPLARPDERTEGEGVLRNLSREGAYLTDIRLPGGSLPAEPFGIRLSLADAPLAGWDADCKVVRLQVVDRLSAGLEFVKMTDRNAKKLDRLLA